MISTVECPKCHNRIVARPTKILSNSTFTIEAYECDRCHNKFKVTR